MPNFLRPSSLSIFPLFAVAALACSSSSGSGTGGSASTGTGTGGTTTSTTTTPTGTGGGGGPACAPGQGYGGAGSDVQVGTATGKIVDETGAPIPDLLIQVCGTNICINGKTDQTGSTSVLVNKMLTKPAFKFGDALTYPRLAIPFSESAPSFPGLVDVKLPATGVDFAPGKSVTSGPVTLTLEAGAAVVVDELNYPEPDSQKLRIVSIPVDKESAVLDPTGLKLELLYGASPIETTFCPAATVTVPNDLGWAAGTAVEFYILGVDVSQEYAPYGGWAKASDGAVSADGKTISTAAGAGFPILETFGIRQKP